jgi:hypothetical protein
MIHDRISQEKKEELYGEGKCIKCTLFFDQEFAESMILAAEQKEPMHRLKGKLSEYINSKGYDCCYMNFIEFVDCEIISFDRPGLMIFCETLNQKYVKVGIYSVSEDEDDAFVGLPDWQKLTGVE